MSSNEPSVFSPLSKSTVIEWVNVPQLASQSPGWQFSEFTLNIFSSSWKGKACCERPQNSWNWLIFFYQSTILLIVWSKDPGMCGCLDMKWHSINLQFHFHPWMHLHPMRAALYAGAFNSGNVILGKDSSSLAMKPQVWKLANFHHSVH